ncbi:MAG TPA: heavy metal-associated domain-containing protein [Candidatus Nanoarchaeia archaeon]|nr:heavy metal-associated domain-containing protein [Candidatus Nanoarchaeia archaeon]
MKKIKLSIEGMHCASCGSNIERSVKKVPGVQQVTVNVMIKKGYVTAEDNVKEEDIKAAVAKTGYKVSSIEKA